MLARFLRQRKGYALPFHLQLAMPRTLTRCMTGHRSVKASSPLQGCTARILPAATGMLAVPTLLHQYRFVSSAYATSVPCERFDVDTTELARVMHNTALPSSANIFVMDLRKKRKAKARPNSRKTMSTVIAAHRAASQKAAADGLAGDDDAYVPPPLIFVVKSSDTVKQAAHRQRTMEAYLQELNAAGEFFVCVLNAAQTRHWTRFVPTAHSTEAGTADDAAATAATAAAGVAEGSASTPPDAAAPSPPAAASEAVREAGGDEGKTAGEEDEEEWEEVEIEEVEEDGADAEGGTGGEASEAAKLPEDAPSVNAEKAADRDAEVDAREAATNDTHSVSDKSSPLDGHHSESTDSAAGGADADPPLEEFDLDGAFAPADGDAAPTTSKSASPEATATAADPAPTAAAAAALDPIELASETTPVTTSTIATATPATVDAAPPAPPTQTEKDEVAVEQPTAATETTPSTTTPTEPAEPSSKEQEEDEPTAADIVEENTPSADAEVQERKEVAEEAPAAPLPQPTTPMPVYVDVPARLFNGASTSHLSDRARRELPSTANVLIIDHLDWTAEDSADVEAALAQVDPVVGHLLFYRDAYVLQSECTVKENHVFRDELVPFIFAFRTALSKTAALAVQRRLVEAKRRRPAGLTAKQQALLAGQHDRTFVCVICAEESEVGGENLLEDPQARPKPATPSSSVQHEDVDEKSGESGRREVDTGEKGGEGSVEDEAAVSATSDKWQESTRASPSPWLSKKGKKQDVAASPTRFDHDHNNEVENSRAGTTFHTGTTADEERDAPSTSSASPSPSLQLGLLGLDTMRFSHTPRRAYWTPHEPQSTVEDAVEERAARAATEDPLQAAKEDHEGDDWGSTDRLSGSQDASTSESSSTTTTTTSDAADPAKGRGGKRNGRKTKAAPDQTEEDKKAAIAAVEAEAAAAEAALKAFMEKLCKGADTGAGERGQHGASAKVSSARSKVKAKARNNNSKKK